MRLHRLLAASAVVQGVGLLLTLLLGIQLARFLGPEAYGVYGVAMAAASIVTLVAQFGLPLLAMREAARPDANLRALGRWFGARGLVISVAVSLAVALILTLVGPPWLSGRGVIVALTAAFVVALAMESLLVAIFRSGGKNVVGQGLDLVVRPAMVAAIVLALHLGRQLSVPTALAAQLTVVTAVLAGLAAWLAVTPKGSVTAPPDRWAVTSATFMANGLLGAINANYPLLVAGFFVSATDLGSMRVALSSALLVNLPGAIANIATVPLIARQVAAQDRKGLAHTLAQTSLACFALTLFAWLLLLFAGRPLIMLLFGSAYLPAYWPLVWLGAGQLIIAAFGVSGSYFNLSGREPLVIRAFLLAVPVGIATSWLLARSHGNVGAAVGAVAMAAVWHGYIFLWRRDEVDQPLFVLAAWRSLRHEAAE